jgi:hypothetical protein
MLIRREYGGHEKTGDFWHDRGLHCLVLEMQGTICNLARRSLVPVMQQDVNEFNRSCFSATEERLQQLFGGEGTENL